VSLTCSSYSFSLLVQLQYFLHQAHLHTMRAFSFLSTLAVLPAVFASPVDFELQSHAGMLYHIGLCIRSLIDI
jgi:hypothetical protein